MPLRFEKWQAAGNDFVLIEGNQKRLPATSELARQLCNRRFGVGADGLVIVGPSTGVNCRMEIFNPDGTEAETCGNALRCVAKKAGKDIAIETRAGITKATLIGDKDVRVEMGAIPAITEHKDIFAMQIGTPHAVVFVKNFDFDWQEEGRALEHRTDLFPNKTNVDFVWVRSRDALEIRTWERSVGHTLACGTGACAAATAALSKGLVSNVVRVISPGGTLVIEQKDGKIYMTGPAVKVFEGISDY